MNAGWSFGYKRRYSDWLRTVAYSVSTMNSFIIDYLLVYIFQKVMKCNYMGKIFQNNSNVHVCSLARASITRHLCCRI